MSFIIQSYPSLALVECVSLRKYLISFSKKYLGDINQTVATFIRKFLQIGEMTYKGTNYLVGRAVISLITIKMYCKLINNFFDGDTGNGTFQ